MHLMATSSRVFVEAARACCLGLLGALWGLGGRVLTRGYARKSWGGLVHFVGHRCSWSGSPSKRFVGLLLDFPGEQLQMRRCPLRRKRVLRGSLPGSAKRQLFGVDVGYFGL